MDNEGQTVIYIHNWNDICRLCLRNDQPLHNIFLEINMLENIQEVTNLPFSVEDSLPNSVCKLCIDQVNSFVDFRVRCKATDEWLRNEATVDTKDSNVEIVEVVDIWNDGTSQEKKENTNSQLAIKSTNDKNCLCEDCGEIFETSKQLTSHIKIHSSGLIKCKACNEIISVLDNYNKLEHSLLNEQTKLCENCTKLNNIDNLEVKTSYTETEDGYLCDKCHKVFKTLSGMLNHLRNYEKKLETGSMSYQCHFCEEAFTTIQQVWIHMKTHAPGEKIKCRHCEKCFKSYLTLVRHENKHEGTFNYVCSYCGRAFVTPYGRDRHEMTHNAAKNVQCEKCTMTFYTRAEYNRHMRYHDNIRNFLCSFCGKRFFESAHKTIHERTHTGERPFACIFCGKKFMSKQKTRRHQAIHSKHKLPHKSESENYIPEIIDSKELLLVESEQFEDQLIDDPEPVDDDQQIENEIELSHCIVPTEGAMEEVMQITADEEETLETNSSDYQCTVCGKELLSAYTLGNHMRSHTGERPYGCSVCEKFFKTKSNLNEHYRVHNPELRWMKTSSRDIPSITRVTITSEDMLTCSYCSKVFTSLDALSAHERTHDDDDELRQQQTLLMQTPDEMLDAAVNAVMRFTCEQCNKNFTSKSLLSAHISNNCASVAAAVGADVDASNNATADHRHRQCPYCSKQFRSAVTLENHKRVHTREKPFGCDSCAKVFRTKGNLLEHKRVHNNSLWLMKSDTKLPATHHDTGAADERFQCTYCAKPFRTYTAMLNHERVHTREKPFECSVCGKLFRTKSNMTEHMKGCHDIDSSASGGTDEVQVFTFKTQAAFCKS